ncbi:MAG: hypothetical protein WC260_04240 [Candidatus Pacearchaeota archaeon]
MSHFTVAVFTKEGQTVDELLAPFHEFECTGHVDEYVKTISILDKAKDEYNNYIFTKLQSPDGKLYNPNEDQFYREPTEEEKETIGMGSGFGKGISWFSKDWKDGKGYRAKVKFIPNNYKEIEVKATDIMSFKEFVEYYYETNFISENEELDLHNEQKYGWGKVNDNGEVIELVTRTNPNAKWDWYQIGGRWSGLLKLKPGANSGDYGERSWTNKNEIIPEHKVDTAKVKDIDFSIDEKEYNKAIRFWELKIEEDTPKNKEEEDLLKSDWYKKEYYTERYNSKEQYAQLTTEFGTYAVITPDGLWHSKGNMGWWGYSSESNNEAKQWYMSFKEKFIDTADPEWTLTVVDCHI